MIPFSPVHRNCDVPEPRAQRNTAPSKGPLLRRFATQRDIYAFLAARDFRKVPDGWSNGNWFATIRRTGSEFLLALELDARAHQG